MSFRSRLTTFFLLIVVVPMIAVGFLVFRLIDDSQQGKADARLNGLATAATGLYLNASREGSLDAGRLARSLAGVPTDRLQGRVRSLAGQAGLARVTVSIGSRQVATFGDPTAIAPGIGVVPAQGSRPSLTVAASELPAAALVRELSGAGVAVVVREDGATLASSLPGAPHRSLPAQGNVKLGSTSYAVATQSLQGFAGRSVRLTILSDLAATGGSASTDRTLAVLVLVAFLSLAFGFALLVARAIQGQLAEFLQAARRLAAGDFSAQVPTSGRDDFAALGREFNNMSNQLASRLDELESERARVRRSIRRIGEAFAANLDRAGLLEIALSTATDATVANCGRVTAREHPSERLSETIRLGQLDGCADAIHEAERRALEEGGIGQASSGERFFGSVALGPMVPGGPTHGLITVGRSGRQFSEDDLELLRTLAASATLALANVSLHYDIQRQAVTDDLTGLASHGHFQELLGLEMVEVRRYRYPVGLIMIDLDNFKSINDRYGHQQGDVVLRSVADVLRANSRESDIAARYGGEELALILPHTDLDGTFVIAERIRESIQALEIPLEGDGTLRITASIGAASSCDAGKDELIAAADNALYVAKREGKNRTVKAAPDVANVIGGR